MAIYNVLKDKLGNIFNPIIPRYEKGIYFSTNEIKTKDKWINGKPIYLKVIQTGVVTTTESHADLNVSDLDEVIDLSGGGYMSSGGHFLPWNFENSGGFTSCYFRDTENRFVLAVSTTSYNLSKGHIIARYTKTTD